MLCRIGVDMKYFAETLSDSQRKRARMTAYAAAWCGGFADLLLDSSGVFIIYFALLDAGSSIIMLSTGIAGIVSMLLMIPSAGIVDKLGTKRSIRYACILACCGYLLAALAPLFGAVGKFAVLAGIAVYCLYRPLWTTAWYTVVGNILLPEERAGFFGFMRFSYYIITGGSFAILGVLMGTKPPQIFLQLIIGACGLLVLGRGYFISRLKLPPHQAQNYDLPQAFSISVHNSPLVGFSVYSCFMMLAFAPVLPLALTYLQNTLHLGADWVQLLSCAGIAGNVCGFFFYGKTVKKIGIRNLEILIHFTFILIPLALAFCHDSLPYVEIVIGVLLFLGNFVYACFYCAFSQEILALARPGNATMASAFANTYMQIGIAVGRSTAGFLLGCGALTATWQMWGVGFTDFQTLFLICSGLALFGLILIFSLPSVIPKHDDYYAP